MVSKTKHSETHRANPATHFSLHSGTHHAGQDVEHPFPSQAGSLMARVRVSPKVLTILISTALN